MRPRRVDDNHAAIVSALRKIGYSVLSLAPLGRGAPDLLAARPGGCTCGGMYLFEVKDGAKVPSARKLTPDEERFHAAWVGDISIVESIEDAIRTVGMTD